MRSCHNTELTDDVILTFHSLMRFAANRCEQGVSLISLNPITGYLALSQEL